MCDSAAELYTFVSSSKGGLSAIGDLLAAYSRRRRMKPDEIPVIELLQSSYIHKDYGETFKPKAADRRLDKNSRKPSTI